MHRVHRKTSTVVVAVLLVAGVVGCTPAPTPTPTPTPTGVVAVAAGYAHSCALMAGGTVKCWGFNGNPTIAPGAGALGNGSDVGSLTPVDVTGLSGVKQIAAGNGATCAVLTAGNIKCWGWNAAGRLGTGLLANTEVPTADVVGITGATQVSTGQIHTCAVVSGGVECWGANNDGELGTGNNVYFSVPQTVAGVSGATQVSTGYYHTCALVTAGRVKCWGRNIQGQLGDGSTVGTTVPVDVKDESGNVLSGAVSIAAGEGHTCAVMGDGSAKCWGSDGRGLFSHVALAVSGVSNAREVAAGFIVSCAVIADGTVKCWGANYAGVLGFGSTIPSSSPTPVTVLGLSDATHVALTNSHVCVTRTGGSVQCWGLNADGELGNGTKVNASSPVNVVGLG